MTPLIYLLLCIVFTSIGQVLLKIGSRSKYGGIMTYLNTYTVCGYLSLFLVTIFSVLALKGFELKLLYVLMSLNFVLIMGLSKIVLGEPVTGRKIIATVLICLGIVIFNL